jgi:hypothetical protein
VDNAPHKAVASKQIDHYAAAVANICRISQSMPRELPNARRTCVNLKTLGLQVFETTSIRTEVVPHVSTCSQLFPPDAEAVRIYACVKLWMKFLEFV